MDFCIPGLWLADSSQKAGYLWKNTTRCDDLWYALLPGVNSVGLWRSFLSGQPQLK